MDQHDDPRVPAWARLMNAAQYGRFVDLVLATLERHGVQVELPRESLVTGALVVRRGGRERETLGLGTLVQVCHQAPPDDWPEIVEGHFAPLIGPQRAAGDMLEARLLDDFDRARASLRVRLYHASYREEVGADRLVWREQIDGIVSTLVLDLPWSVRSLQPAEVARWGRPLDEVFDVALDNVRAHCRPDVERVAPGGRAPMVFLTSPEGDFFTASHALLLERHPEALGAHGAILGIPHRHMVVAHPFEGAQVIDAVSALVPFVRRCHAEGPGSIDPDLFWYRAGRYLRLPSVRDAAGVLHFAPPEEFADYVGGLREER